MILNESLFDNYSDWEEVSSKSVADADGFMTDYTWYKKVSEDGSEQHIFIFGDKDIYTPDSESPDYETDDAGNAENWFKTYNGFADDLDECKEQLKEDKNSFVSGRYVYFKYKQVEGMTAEQLAKSIEKAYKEKFRDEIKVTHIEKHSYDFSNKEIPYIVSADGVYDGEEKVRGFWAVINCTEEEGKNLPEDAIIECLKEGAVKDIALEIEEAGGKDIWLAEMKRKIEDCKDMLKYLKETAPREINRGGAYDSYADIQEAIDEITAALDELEAKYSIAA